MQTFVETCVGFDATNLAVKLSDLWQCSTRLKGQCEMDY